MSLSAHRRALFGGTVCFAGFGLWSGVVDRGLARPMDLTVARAFHDRMPEVLAWFFGLVCRSGNVEFSLPLWIVLLIAIARRNRSSHDDRLRQALVLTFFLLLGSVVEHVMKRSLHQPLPFLNRDPLDVYLHPVISIKTPFSYPSGHTFRAFMVFSLVSVLVRGREPSRLLRWGVWATLIAIGVNAIGWHWTSDVIGSLFFVGGAYFLSWAVVREGSAASPGP